MIKSKSILNRANGATDGGQALLFVVVATTIALAIGINASVRTITSLSRSSRSDTASRALAAAEGGLERFLALSTTELENAIAGNCAVGVYDDKSNTCEVEFNVGSSDAITSQAYVSVKRYEPAFYPFKLESGQVKEINLYDYNSGSFYAKSQVEICWTSEPASEIMYLAYNKSGVQASGGLTGDNPPGGSYDSDGFDSAGGGHDDFNNCRSVDIGSNIYGLRIRSVGGDSKVGVFPTGGSSLPLQGYTINSVGKIAQSAEVTATRSITIIRTLPYLPVSFDYALYSAGSITK